MQMKKTEDGRHWKRMGFRTNKIWVKTDPDGRPVLENGKVIIKYRLDHDYEYRVNENDIHSLDAVSRIEGEASKKTPRKKKTDAPKPVKPKGEPLPENTIFVYTDGASSGNPGPSGIGVLLKYKGREKYISKYIGNATNNIAELEAIKAGLSEIKNKAIPVRVYTDSTYAVGVLALGWKPRKNVRLVQSLKDLIAAYNDIAFVKVKGHAGHRENEIADRLAVEAVARRA
ncbi:MAG: ribonuclease H [Desulfobacterales bacterium]